jgi:hypothetical protein
MATYFVAVDGNDAADGSTQTPFRTIGFALAFAQAQRIVIRAGRYAEGPLAVSRPVEIIGTGAILEGHLDIAAEGRVLVRARRDSGAARGGARAGGGARRPGIRDRGVRRGSCARQLA